MKKDNFVKDALILSAITLVCGLGLGVVYQVTKDPIAAAKRAAALAAYRQVLDSENYEDVDSALTEEVNGAGEIAAMCGGAQIDSAVIAKDASGKIEGYIVTAEAKGYGGAVKVVVGIDPEKTVTGISFPETLPETPGLGQKAVEPDFYGQYAGKQGTLTVSKTATGAEGEIVAISGATITSTAVTNAVNAAEAFAETFLTQEG